MSRLLQDYSRPRHERLSDLLAEMTPGEKAAQLGSDFAGFSFEANLATEPGVQTELVRAVALERLETFVDGGNATTEPKAIPSQSRPIHG